MYMERYDVSSEGHIQNAFQVPDPFPKGKPDFRKKHEEERKQQEEQQRQQQEDEERKKKEDEERKQKEEAEEEAKKLKEAEEKEEAEKKEQEKKEAEKKKQQAKELENSNEEAVIDLIDRNDAPLTEEELAQPLATRVANRKTKYLQWMKDFRKLSASDQKAVSTKLQGRFLGMEQKEKKSFEKPIQYTEDEKVDGKVQPAGKKVVLLTATDGNGNSEIQNVLKMAMENRAEYAAYHGYTDYFVNLTKFAEPNRHPVWDKISAIKEAFDANPEAEWVWWVDTDIIIMNPEIDVAEHILSKRALKERLSYGRPLRNPEANFYNGAYMKKGEVDIDNIDIVLCQDFFGLNAGSFFIRRSSFSALLLDLWDDPLYVKANFVRREQDALINMFLYHESVQQHVGLVPQRLLNSYADKPEWVWAYVEGDFVVHFAGCNTRGRCNEVWKTHWEKRTRVPEAYRVANSVEPAASSPEKTETSEGPKA